jgi:hypothetical protein
MFSLVVSCTRYETGIDSADPLHAGDAAGNVRVYNLLTLSLVAVQEAHDSEVLSLDYSPGFLVSGG